MDYDLGVRLDNIEQYLVSVNEKLESILKLTGEEPVTDKPVAEEQIPKQVKKILPPQMKKKKLIPKEELETEVEDEDEGMELQLEG